jgi:hypothetical protein
MDRVDMQFAVTVALHELGVAGAKTVPVCDGGIGIGFGRTSTWKYDPPEVLSTKATFFPSTDKTGEVRICPPVCVRVLYAKETEGTPLLHFGLASV